MLILQATSNPGAATWTNGSLFSVSTIDSSVITNGVGFQTFDITSIIPANIMGLGSTARIRGWVRSTAINAAETKQVRVRIGGVVIATSTAVALGVDEVMFFDVYVVTRAAPGAAVDTVAAGAIGDNHFTGNLGVGAMANGSTLATNAALTIDVQVAYSAEGGNSSFLECLMVDVVG